MPSSTNTLWDSIDCPTFSHLDLQTVLALSLLPASLRKKLPTPCAVKNHAVFKQAEIELKNAEAAKIEIIPISSSRYPASFRQLTCAPLVLYVKGTLPPEDAKKIGIVGTRCATTWGIECTKAFAKELSSYGAYTISGLARGIDTAAHEMSIDRTCAIIGSGLLHIYPRENVELAEKISCVLSELPLHTAPTRFSFPRRNRLIAALSDALLLTEAPIKSGAMITMDIGFKQKKPLFTVPGRAMNSNYGGNHQLLKLGQARLVESPEELAHILKISIAKPLENNVKNHLISGQEQKILDILCQEEVSIDMLSVKTCLPIATLQVLLMKLVLRKLAVELPGKHYRGI